VNALAVGAAGELIRTAKGEVMDRPEDDFDRVWERLANEAKCDGLGASQYRRVKTEWIACGRPTHIKEFIMHAADRPPTGPGRESLN
jgi:hypothetical protein